MSLALYYKTLPPTLCSQINPDLNLEQTPFYLNTESRPWIHSSQTPRRAGVNAFGFGGINSHAILEEYIPAQKHKSATRIPLTFAPASVSNQWSWELIVITGTNPTQLLNTLKKIATYLSVHPETSLADISYTLANQIAPEHHHRLAIIASSLDNFQEKISFLQQSLSSQKFLKSFIRKGIFYSQQPQDLGKIAFVFSSEGAQYSNMLADVCLCFPQVRQWFDLLEEAFPRDNPPSQFIFPAPTTLNEEQKQWQEQQLYAADLATNLSLPLVWDYMNFFVI